MLSASVDSWYDIERGRGVAAPRPQKVNTGGENHEGTLQIRDR